MRVITDNNFKPLSLEKYVKLMKRQNITQAEIADAANVTQPYICLLLKDGRANKAQVHDLGGGKISITLKTVHRLDKN